MDNDYKIRIQQSNNKQIMVDCSQNETILEAMIRQNIRYRSDCGGRGTCGKCKLQVISGELEITSQDQKLFTKEELNLGYRLSCKAYPSENIAVRLFTGDESDMEVITKSNLEVLSSNAISSADAASPADTGSTTMEEDYVIGIDLGTTTLAVSLVGIKSKRLLQTYTAVNPQRAFGADVISRIKASNEGKKDQLQEAIRNSLRDGILSVIGELEIEMSSIKKIAIAGNTTMGHLLMGYSCETLGIYPFTPVRVDTIELILKDIFSIDDDEKILNTQPKNMKPCEINIQHESIQQRDSNKHCDNNLDFETNIKYEINQQSENNQDFETNIQYESIQQRGINDLLHVPVVLLPGISTFVGGDILAGLLVCGFHAMKKPCLLIDLGTNGEMALGNKEKILVSSTAAGPAFEGGNISCGVGSIPGAISNIHIQGADVTYKTIGDKLPIGICGTGVVEIASELFNAGFMDETGLLIDEYFKEGFPIPLNQSDANKSKTNSRDRNKQYDNSITNTILFTQKDVRELQLAKAAIRAGIDVLVKNYNITMEQIDKVYLAGGFGFKMDVEKAIHIGLLPEEFRNKIHVIGNSSLAGAVQYLIEPASKEDIDQILTVSQEIHLSNDVDFNELYLEYMSFPVRSEV